MGWTSLLGLEDGHVAVDIYELEGRNVECGTAKRRTRIEYSI